MEAPVTKCCSICKELKEVSNFYKKGTSKFHSYCKICFLAKGIIYYKENCSKIKARVAKFNSINSDKVKSRNRDYALKKRYNITSVEYKDLIDKQEGKCAICKTVPKILAIDHCHKTGNIRGLLCKKCNSGIGYLKDDVDIVKNAWEYLNGSRQKD